jgi:hypothetical protein
MLNTSKYLRIAGTAGLTAAALTGLAMTTAAAADAAFAVPSGAGQQSVRPANTPALTAKFGVAAQQVTASGTVGSRQVRGAPPRTQWRAVLEEKVGRRWVSRASGRLTTARTGRKKGTSTFRFHWSAPPRARYATLRVRIVARGRTIAISHSCRLDVSALPKDTRPPPDPPAQVKPDTIEQVPTGRDPQLVIDGARHYKKGQLITAPPSAESPEGFLVKVEDAKVEGDRTVVETRPASLYEVVPQGSLDVDLGDIESATPQNETAAAISRAMASRTAGTASYTPIDLPITCEGNVTGRLQGRLDVDVRPIVSLNWRPQLAIPPVAVDTAKAQLSARLGADMRTTISGDGKCEAEAALAEPQWTVPVPIGPVTVPVTVSIPITAAIEASAQGKASVRATASAAGLVGFEYANGRTSTRQEFKPKATLKTNVKGSTTLDVTVGPALSIAAGWHAPVLGGLAAEASVGVKSGVVLGYDTTRPGNVNACIPIRVAGDLKFHLPVVAPIVVGPLTMLDRNIRCWDTLPQ